MNFRGQDEVKFLSHQSLQTKTHFLFISVIFQAAYKYSTLKLLFVQFIPGILKLSGLRFLSFFLFR